MGAGDGSSTSSSIINNKQINHTSDIDTLPPNKRRLREKNVGLTNPFPPPSTTTTTTTEPQDNSPIESTTVSRELPVNNIKQFLEIRQQVKKKNTHLTFCFLNYFFTFQIDKRHETMVHDFVLPKIPKDFSETTMAKKSYLIAPSFSPYSSTTPASLGIKRYPPPHDLDLHLAEVFTKQEDERYRMKLRHQVERVKKTTEDFFSKKFKLFFCFS